jgi:hypothetical protein
MKPKMYIYLKNGNVDVYEVESVLKAREHAEKIWSGGYRMRVGTRMEWFGPHWVDKICWDMTEEDYLSTKYEKVIEK